MRALSTTIVLRAPRGWARRCHLCLPRSDAATCASLFPLCLARAHRVRICHARWECRCSARGEKLRDACGIEVNRRGSLRVVAKWALASSTDDKYRDGLPPPRCRLVTHEATCDIHYLLSSNKRRSVEPIRIRTSRVVATWQKRGFIKGAASAASFLVL